MNVYKLDPCHYVSAPSLSFDAMLKYTGVELELLQDSEQYLFCERGIRGGYSAIAHRQATANNKYLENYNPEQESSYLMYLDANNFYGWAMTQPMPLNDFKWENVSEYDAIIESQRGCILEVDLEYPSNLYPLHSDFPLAPHHLDINYDMLSGYAKEFVKTSYKSRKLCQTFMKRERYVIHRRNLKQYLDMGLKLTKVHRILSFNESCWLKPYVEYNTAMRTMAKTEFEMEFFKLMINSVFGKLMEDVRKHSKIELVTTEKRLNKIVKKPSYKRHVIFGEELVAVESMKTKICLNKPVYAGFSVLELSKTLMYDFHYNVIKAKYEVSSRLLFTDTDSLCYHI